MHHAELVGRGGESAPRLASAATRVHHAGHSTVYCRHAGHLTSAPCRPPRISLHCMQPTQHTMQSTQYAMQTILSLDFIQATPLTSTYHKHKMQISPVHHAGRTISISLQGTQFHWRTHHFTLSHIVHCIFYSAVCLQHIRGMALHYPSPHALQVKPCLQHMEV